MNKHKILKSLGAIAYLTFVLLALYAGNHFAEILFSGTMGLAITLGVRTTANTDSSIHVRNVDGIMPYIWRNQYPITQFFLSKDMRQEMTDGNDSSFEHFEKDQRLAATTISTLTGGSTTATVTPADLIFRLNDTVIIDSTGDVCDVTAVSTTITLRKIGGGNLTNATAGASIRRLATAFSDNFVKQTAYSNNAVGSTGYCQIMLEAIQMTGREQAAKKYGGNEDWDVIFEETAANLMYDQDNSWLMNGAAGKETVTDNSGTGVKTYSAGLRGAITTNVSEYAGTLDMTEVDDNLETFMVRGVKGYANEWIGWAGTKYLRQLNAALKKERQWQQSDADKKDAIIRVYGGLHKSGANPDIFTYNAEFGKVYYMWNPNLVDKWSYSCVYVHPQCIKMRFMGPDKNGPRKYRVEENVQTPGGGAKHDQILTDTGLHIKTEKLMSWHNKDVS